MGTGHVAEGRGCMICPRGLGRVALKATEAGSECTGVWRWGMRCLANPSL